MRIVFPQPAYYETLRSMIYRIKRCYPFVCCNVCGRSLAGRAIFALSVGDMKCAPLFVGGVHGQEWLTCLVLLYFFENICKSISKKQTMCCVNMFDITNGITVIPCLNPDSVQIALKGPDSAGCYSNAVRTISGGNLSEWNANARGVDINHNFDAGWELLRQAEEEAGITGPAPRRYGGICPESEPETAALANLSRRCTPCHAVALHSQGEEIYWKYGEAMPERAELMAKLISMSTGYELKENEGLASHGGFKDWFIKEFRKPAFTIEMGLGKNPLPVEDFEEIYSRLEEALTLLAIC